MFKVIVKLAWKNAFLRFSRTFLVIVMIAVSMTMMLALEGLYDGMSKSMVEKTMRSDCGEVSMYNKKYRLNKLPTNSIKDADKILTDLRKNPEISVAIKRFSVEGLSATAHKSAFAHIIGTTLQNEEKFGEFSKFLKSGAVSFENHGAIIGSVLAKKLKIKPGSKVVFSAQDSEGNINSLYLRIRGIVQTTNINIDNSAIYVPISRVYKFLGVSSHEATQIAMRIKNPQVVNSLKKEYRDLDVKSLLELYPMLKQMQDMMHIFNSITFAIVMLVVFIGIFGVMYVSILDRIREFGILKAIGMAYSYIRLQILFEAVIIGLLGYIFGVIFGYASLLYLQVYGLDLSAYADGLEKFGYGSILYATIKPIYFSTTFFAIITASLLSALLPLRKIKKLHPVDVIKVQT